MKVRLTLVAAALTALIAAGCGSSNSSSSSAGGGSTSAAAASTSSSAGTSSGGGSGSQCTASIGIEAPMTGQVAVHGQEQLASAELAIADDNAANGTNISLVQSDTQLQPAQATTVTQQFTSNNKIVGVIGPAGSQEVEAVG